MKRNLLILLIISSAASLHSQEKSVLRYSVSYVAASVVYIGAGRDGNIAVGDTVKIYRDSSQIGVVVVSAVSKKSSSTRIISQLRPIAAGDGAVLEKVVAVEQKSKEARPVLPDSAAKSELPLQRSPVKNTDENSVTGRIGLQYSGALAEDSRLNLSQPSVLLRLNIQNLYNTGLLFSIYGRSYYEMSDIYSRYGDNTRFKNRMYDFSLRTNDPDGAIGFGIGRLTSEYVGGMGTFDGGHAFYRYQNFTSGFLFGAKVQDRTLGVDPDETKGAFFVSAKYGTDFLHQYNGTIAYGRQLVKGNLDREFLYLQNFWMMGSELSMYESSEVELNDINNGVKKKTFKLSNTFLSVNYYPVEWLSTNVGYDGSRTIYLFETMKSISDTLLDKNLMQGYRAGATLRLPYFMSISGNLSYRTKKGDARDARTISGTYRISDIMQTEIGAGLRYADIIGVYSNGKNITLDLDRTFFYKLSLALRYDYYKYTILTLKQTYTTHTGTVNASYRFSRSLYSTLAVDGILDNTMNSVRVYAEIGIRF
ncbi:MAG: hypothetical protein WCT99_05280 [Bacteroidota bacterium]|jgi:hypothetical protein